MHKNKLGLKSTVKDLLASGHLFKTYFNHGSLAVELYKPDQVDLQMPHTRDEIYIVAVGSGQFYLSGDMMDVSVGDFLFVPAGADHRFINFSDDFTTWVLFFGPEDG